MTSSDPARDISAGLLAMSVRALAVGSAEPEVRAQLHALSGILENSARTPPVASTRAAAVDEIRAALSAEDEAAAVAAARRLAALDRAGLLHVDWSAASHG